MSTHDERHARLLAEVLQEGEADGQGAAELRACAVCGPELARLLALQAALDRAGAEEDRHIAEAAELEEPTAADAVVGRTVRELASTPARRRRWPTLLSALAAGVIATTVWYVNTDRAPELRDGSGGHGSRSFDVLGGAETDDRIHLSAPIGDVERFGPFEWEGDLPLSGTWRVRVWSEIDGTPITVERELIEPFWDPPPAETAAWPEAIGWCVEALSIDGRVQLESPDARARRR